MFCRKLPQVTVGLGLFFKEKDERHNCNTLSKSPYRTDIASIHSAIFPVQVTISQKIKAENENGQTQLEVQKQSLVLLGQAH